MSWKFNPPPGWPAQPEGWQPPPGWQPDPSWPPAPPGWQFWIPADQVGNLPPLTSPPPPPAPHPQAPGQQSLPGPGGHGWPGHPVTPAGPAGPASGTPASGGWAPADPFSGPPGAPGTGAAGAPAGPGHHRPWHHRWSAFTVVAVVTLLIGGLGGGAAALVTDPADADPPREPSGPDQPPGTGPDTDPQPPPQGLVPGEERTGQGPAIVPLALPADSHHILTVTFTGEGSFSAELVDNEGEFVAPVGNGYEEYNATVPVELGGYDRPTAVDISDAEGSWTLLVEDLSVAPLWPDVTGGSGTGVLRVDPQAVGDGPVTLAGTYEGESNFIVWAYGEDGGGDGLLFNEIGEFSGESNTRLSDASLVISVTASGDWTIEPA